MRVTYRSELAVRADPTLRPGSSPIPVLDLDLSLFSAPPVPLRPRRHDSTGRDLLGNRSHAWLDTVASFGLEYERALGPAGHLKDEAGWLGVKWLSGLRSTQEAVVRPSYRCAMACVWGVKPGGMLLPRHGMIVGPPPTRGGTAVPEGTTSDVESAQDHLPDLRRTLPAASGVHGWNDRVPRMLEGGEHAEPNHSHNTSGLVGHTGLGLDRYMAAPPGPREVGGVP